MPTNDTLDHAFMGETIEPARFSVANAERVDDRQIAGLSHIEESFFGLMMQQRRLDKAATAAD
jgi:hypothetical protein